MESLCFIGRLEDAMEIVQTGIQLIPNSFVFDFGSSKSSKNAPLAVPAEIISALNKLVVQTILQCSLDWKDRNVIERLKSEAYRLTAHHSWHFRERWYLDKTYAPHPLD